MAFVYVQVYTHAYLPLTNEKDTHHRHGKSAWLVFSRQQSADSFEESDLGNDRPYRDYGMLGSEIDRGRHIPNCSIEKPHMPCGKVWSLCNHCDREEMLIPPRSRLSYFCTIPNWEGDCIGKEIPRRGLHGNMGRGLTQRERPESLTRFADRNRCPASLLSFYDRMT